MPPTKRLLLFIKIIYLPFFCTHIRRFLGYFLMKFLCNCDISLSLLLGQNIIEEKKYFRDIQRVTVT